MNDDEVLATVRDSFSGVRMRTPLEQAVRRGQVKRARRRGGRAAALAGTAALAGVAAVTALNLGAPAGTATLAAWTVTASPDHAVHVTIKQLSDAAGLQRVLRADGIPARVTFAHGISDSPPLPAGCRPPVMPVQENIQLQSKILDESGETIANQVTFNVHPQAIPHGIGIYLAVMPQSGNGGYGWGLDLVQATKACTG